MKTQTDLKLDPIDAPAEPIDLKEYFVSIARSKWLIALLMAVAMITTGLISLRQITYEASSTIILSPVALGIFSTPTAISEVVDGDTLLEEVKKTGGLRQSVSQLKKMIGAENATGSNIVTITVSGPDKTMVFRAANLVAERFVVYAKAVDPEAARTAAQLRMTRETIKWLDKILYKEDVAKPNGSNPLLDTSHVDNEIKRAKEELSRVENEDLQTSEKAILLFALNQRLSALEEERPQLVTHTLSLLAQKQSLWSQEQDLMAELEKSDSTKILSRAVKPTAPAAPNIVGNLVFAALAALIAGCGLAIAFKPGEKGDAP